MVFTAFSNPRNRPGIFDKVEYQFKVTIRQGPYILVGFEKAVKTIRTPEFPLMGKNIVFFGFDEHITGKNSRR